MTNASRRLLLASLHDVTPRDFSRIVEIDRFYEEVGVGANYAMLVVPDFWGAWPLDKYAGFADWLKARAKAGVEIFLHGFFHHDTTPAFNRSAWTTFRYAALGEGEFANIHERDAINRLKNGQKMLEDVLGTNVTSFVAPAWQYSSGARKALAESGFTIAENRACVWSPAQGRVLTKTPVIAYSKRSAARRGASILWSKLSEPLLAHAKVVRHAIHPADFDDVSLKNEIRRSLCELLASREAIAYRCLLDTPAFS